MFDEKDGQNFTVSFDVYRHGSHEWSSWVLSTACPQNMLLCLQRRVTSEQEGLFVDLRGLLDYFWTILKMGHPYIWAGELVVRVVSCARPHSLQARGEVLVKSLHTSRAPGMQ